MLTTTPTVHIQNFKQFPVVRPFHPSIAIASFDTMKQVLEFLDISKLNYAKNKFIKEVGYNKKQLRNFYKKFDKIYDINLRLTIHIQNFKQFPA